MSCERRMSVWWMESSDDPFGLPLRMNGMHRAQSDHARLELLSLVTNHGRHLSKSVLTFHRCRPHSVILVITSFRTLLFII